MSAIPLYRSVHQGPRDRIASRRYPPGSLLPLERKRLDESGVGPITVRRALDELVLDGLIERRQGVGGFVRDHARGVVVSMSSFTAVVLTGRLRLVRSLLEEALLPASAEVAERLSVQEGSVVQRLTRLRGSFAMGQAPGGE